MKNLLLFLGIFFITFLASAQTDLFFSEYIEGSGNNKGVEIYNPTDQPIELNNYYVVRYSNGSSVFTEGGVTQLEGTLQPYTTHVLVNGQTESTGTSPACDPELQAIADQLDHDYPAPTYMNGNDAIALLKTTNGVPPSATNPGTPVDLIGEIGLGSSISSETGWSYVQDSTLTYNNSNGDPITGKVINYIVQKNATNGSDYGPFWMSWTSNHSLIRKPDVVAGVLTNPSPFIVKMQWDTLPAQLDPLTGFYSYEDIWDNLGTHACVADPNYNAAVNEFSFATLNIYPNPVVSEHFTITSDEKIISAQVFDIMGKEIINNSFTLPQKEAVVEIGQNHKGIYMVKVTFMNNTAAVQKILVR